MKKQKQPVDRDLVDRSLFARVEPFLYLLPFLIGIAVFTLYPVINVVLMSFKEGYSYLSRGFDQWGLANYQTVLSDPKFSQAIGNTLKYVILVVPISTCIAVVVGVSAESEAALFCGIPDGVFPADGHVHHCGRPCVEADVQQELRHHQLSALLFRRQPDSVA